MEIEHWHDEILAEVAHCNTKVFFGKREHSNLNIVIVKFRSSSNRYSLDIDNHIVFKVFNINLVLIPAMVKSNTLSLVKSDEFNDFKFFVKYQKLICSTLCR